MARNEDVRVAIATLITSVDGARVQIRRGDVYPASHPLVKRFKHEFVTPAEYARRTGTLVEQATAAPGEKRNVSIPKE